MWNIPRSIGQMGPIMVPLKTQKRDFASINLSTVAIAPGKSFRNPNFVNKHPSVHCCYSATPISIPLHKVCQNSDSDTSGIVTNSSQNTADKSAKEIYCEESPARKSPTGGSPVCSGRKRCKKVRKSRKKKTANKNSKQNNSRRQINDMMEVDLEQDVSMNGCEGSISISPKTLHLTDFIVDIPTKMNDEVFTFISISPPCNNRTVSRERELSVCESEDSYIVFDSGSDEELKFSDSDITELDVDDDDDDSDSDIDDDSDSDIEDDFDSSFSVLPCKRVRFPEKEDLCEVHPMVQWSYAYRNARKGPWEEYARDRERFSKRIKNTEDVLRPIFDQRHRENVYRERFNDSI